METTSEFLPAHQCFIVYDDLTKKVAISLRNRLSEKDVKCTIWSEKQFNDNEARLSNFNRLLILSEKIAAEYLAAPSLRKVEITSYVYYKREGRIATILLKKNINFDNVFKFFEKSTRSILEKINIINDDDSNQDFASALDKEIDDIDTNSTSLVVRKDTKHEENAQKAAALLIAVGTGVAFGIIGLVAEFGYCWYNKSLSDKDKKRVLLFAAAREFEKKFFDDFVNAK